MNEAEARIAAAVLTVVSERLAPLLERMMTALEQQAKVNQDLHDTMEQAVTMLEATALDLVAVKAAIGGAPQA